MSVPSQHTSESAGDGETAALRRKLLQHRLGRARDRARASSAIARRPPDLTVVPLSYPQQRLWFLERLGVTGSAYNTPLAVRLFGNLDVPSLSRALNEVVQRHEILRTNFLEQDGVGVQVVGSPWQFCLQAHDVPESDLRRRVREEVALPFDLEKDRLLRVVLLRLGPQDHVLVLTLHHMIIDGWSLDLLMRELSTLYEGFAAGSTPVLPPLPLQYADWAIWQRAWLEDAALQRQLEWWRARLAGAPAALDFPTDRNRPATQSYRGATHRFNVPVGLTAQLETFAQSAGATLFMLLLTVFKLVLSRWSGQQDIVVGTPIANRTRVETESLLGFFVNTLPIRTDLSGNPTFRELLARVRETALSSYVNQDLPFEKMVEAMQPVRDPSRQPLFQVMFALQQWPSQGTKTSGSLGLQILGEDYLNPTAKFDITLTMSSTAAELAGTFEYSADLFEAATIERMAGHFNVLLAQIIADPERGIEELPLLTEAERHRLLVEWNETQTDCPLQHCVHHIFEAQALLTPHALAMVHGEERLTYAELNRRAGELAHYLHERGVRLGEHVVIMLERSSALVMAQLAILKCGAAYVPLDSVSTVERQVFVVNDCRARFLLSIRGTQVSERLLATRINLDELPAGLAVFAEDTVSIDSEATAYVMYTSGSTGRPKGVAIPHRAVVRLILDNGYAPFDATDRVAFAANPGFDASTMEVWAPLLHGGCSVVIDQSTLLDPSQLSRTLKRQEVTTLFMTTALFNCHAGIDPTLFAGLRFVLIGGERAEAAPCARVLRERGPRHLINCYGPTETTTFATTYEVSDLPDGARNIPIGRPISNTRVYILDRYGQPVPVGVAGEIYIGGDGVARGYLNNPELSGLAFLRDPFRAEPAARIYRTGDMGRYLPDGNIEFLGRYDQQVKIRGFRIELAEIEAHLMQLAGVHEAHVLAREEGSGDKRLVAYLTALPGIELSVGTLRGHLGKVLPAYMIPAAFVVLPRFPLTRNGKLDINALPAPPTDASEQAEFDEPRGEVETAIARIWCELLQAQRIGRHDSFFELGGHSLTAMKVAAQIGRHFQVDVPIQSIFMGPTVAELACTVAENVARRGSVTWTTAAIPLRRLTQSIHAILFMPTVFGVGTVYARLAQLLRTPGEILTCRLPGTAEGEVPLSSIEQIAAHCLTEMIQPAIHKEWSLIGWSFGGVVAYELARQLAVIAVPVRRVILFDSYMLEPTQMTDLAAQAYLESDFRRVFGHDADSSSVLASLLPVGMANLAAHRAYVGGPYSGPLVELQAAGTVGEIQAGNRPQLRYLGRTDDSRIVVPGDHYSILEPDRLPLFAHRFDELLAATSSGS
jgi:amino acid adenylation domain-containing protein